MFWKVKIYWRCEKCTIIYCFYSSISVFKTDNELQIIALPVVKILHTASSRHEKTHGHAVTDSENFLVVRKFSSCNTSYFSSCLKYCGNFNNITKIVHLNPLKVLIIENCSQLWNFLIFSLWKFGINVTAEGFELFSSLAISTPFQIPLRPWSPLTKENRQNRWQTSATWDSSLSR